MFQDLFLSDHNIEIDLEGNEIIMISDQEEESLIKLKDCFVCSSERFIEAAVFVGDIQSLRVLLLNFDGFLKSF